MKNNSNIYDIDGNLIRAAGDNHHFTIDEIEKMVDEMAEKVQNNPENEVYKVYLNNLQKWLFNMYNNMTPEEIKSRLSIFQQAMDAAKTAANEAEQAKLDEVNAAIDQLVMDEYVEPIEDERD